jgi:hypothetical protein
MKTIHHETYGLPARFLAWWAAGSSILLRSACPGPRIYAPRYYLKQLHHIASCIFHRNMLGIQRNILWNLQAHRKRILYRLTFPSGQRYDTHVSIKFLSYRLF